MRLKMEHVVIALFFLLSLYMIVHHEAWRDEAQPWLIARDSPSFLSVVRQMNREGTPGLWFYMAYPLARAGLPFFGMQLVNLLIVLCIVAIVMRCAPFPRYQKVLFIFGYYIFYEYNVIVRTYVLSVLFLVAIAALYKYRFTKPVAYSLLVLLLANTNVHGIIVAAILAGAYLLESLISGGAWSKRTVRLAFSLMVLGLVAAMCQTVTFEERAECWAGWHWEPSRLRISEVFYALELAFLPVSGHPFFSGPGEVNFWGSVLVRYPACIPVAVPLFGASVALLLRKRVPLAIYLGSTLGLLSLFWLKYPGARRHIGFIYISFIVATWISECYQDAPSPPRGFLRTKCPACVFTTLLLLQLLGSAQAVYHDLRYDFSPAKRVAGYLEEHGYLGDDFFIAAFPSTKAQAVALYLPKPHSRIFQVECERFGTYAAHTREFMRDQATLRIEDVVRRVDRGMQGGHYRAAVLILNERMDGNAGFAARYELIASFERHIAEDEPLYIYRLNSPPPRADAVTRGRV